MSTKGYLGFVLCLDLHLFANIKKTRFLNTHKNRFIYNSRPKENKKNSEHLLVDIGGEKVRTILAKKYLTLW